MPPSSFHNRGQTNLYMKVKIHKSVEGDIAAIVDWSVLEPYWQKDQTKPPDRNGLYNKYSPLWFNKNNGVLEFIVSEIGWCEHLSSIGFSNGRNRTALITKFINNIPVAFGNEDDLNNEVIKSSIIKLLKDGDEVELPDLPILNSRDLGYW